MYVIYRSVQNHSRIAKVNVIGLLIIFSAFFNDFALGNNWYQGPTLMLPAVWVYVILHVISLSRDFAKRTQKTEELAHELQEEVKRKDNFLANTSHELRNPLHGIVNIAQSILRNRRDQLDQSIKDDLTLQLSVGHHMSHTIDDLLDVARLEENKIKLSRQAVNMNGAVRGVADMLQFSLENKDIKLSIHIADDFPSVYADKKRLTQILFNLIHNAIKYTKEGSIKIVAHVEGDIATIQIKDTGIGMDEALLHTIFEPYAQGDASMTAAGGGIGLGLSICKQLIDMHGGTIEAESELHKGSVFTFTLPLADEGVAEAEGEVSASEEMPDDFSMMEKVMVTNVDKQYLTYANASKVRPKILAVDDDAINLRVLENILSSDSYEVETVTNATKALEKIKENEWDLVIADVMMPNMSGYELAKIIRERYAISELPILLLTARDNPEDIYTGFLSGANDYVTKPVDAIELNARVHALTDLKININERLKMEAAWLQAQIRPHFILNTLNAIMSFNETDPARMTKLMEQFALYLQQSFHFKNIDKLIPLRSEMDLLKSYLYIEKERFGDRLTICWEMDEAVHVMIPPLSLQTLVENAVNHGVLKRISGGMITIKIKHVSEGVKIAVKDDGVGMDEQRIEDIFTIRPDERRGIGLINTEQRLKQLYGAGLKIKSTTGVGTTISFVIPK